MKIWKIFICAAAVAGLLSLFSSPVSYLSISSQTSSPSLPEKEDKDSDGSGDKEPLQAVPAAPGAEESGKEIAFSETDPVAAGFETLKIFERAAERARQGGFQDESGQAQTDSSGVVEGVMEKGDTLSKILESASDEEAARFISAARKAHSLSAFKTGQPYVVIKDPKTGKLIRFEYEINSTIKLIVEGAEAPRARLEKIDYDTMLDVVNCAIEDNLFQAVADAGENPSLALRIVDLFGSEINFIRDIQEGDSFSALIEKRYREGEYKGYGRVLAATFTNKGKTFEAFLFPDNAGQNNYYNAKGENLRKTLLQAPLAITRLTSRYSQSRQHPILGKARPHLGVDYGAPAGTPVKAVGDGVVTKRGWAGGYGNQIIIRHAAGLESLYAHLSGFAASVKTGQRARQGQVIGYVGSTGLSTGPHLDFRLRQNGKFINPAKAINPRGASVPQNEKTRFLELVKKEKNWLTGASLPQNYTVDSLVPLLIQSGGKLDNKIEAESKAQTVKKSRRAQRATKKQRPGKRS